MKKLIVLLMLVFVASAVFGMQESFNASSYEYQQVLSLCRIAGVETKQLVAPISADQMIIILESIPDGRLSKTELEAKNDLIEHLENPYMIYGKEDYGFDAIVTSCPDVFFHTSDKEVLLHESVETRRDILPFFQIGGDVYFSKYFFGTWEYNNTISEIDRKSTISTNYNFKDFNVEITSPYKAYVSVGKDAFNFTIGREQLSLGKGKTGTLLLGDNFLFEDFAKISYFNKLFSYDMTLITFDNSRANNHVVLETYDHNSAHQLVAVHQFSFQPLKWFNLSLTEGMLQYGDNLFGDISIISPFMMLHDVNSYIAGTANNFFSIDFSFAVAKGWEINGSMFFDQIQQSHELNEDGTPSSTTSPNANAFLLNAVYSTQVAGGLADFYVEGVYTNPAVYLKDKYGYKNTGRDNYWNVDLIVGNALASGAISDISYLGYKYGPDTIMLATGFDYNHSKLQLSFDTMFKIHGEKGMTWYDQQNDCNGVGADYYNEVSPTGTPEYRLSFVTTAKYNPFDWLTVNAQVGLINAWNYHNVEGEEFNDLQVALGVKFNPIRLGKSLIVK